MTAGASSTSRTEPAYPATVCIRALYAAALCAPSAGTAGCRPACRPLGLQARRGEGGEPRNRHPPCRGPLHVGAFREKCSPVSRQRVRQCRITQFRTAKGRMAGPTGRTRPCPTRIPTAPRRRRGRRDGHLRRRGVGVAEPQVVRPSGSGPDRPGGEVVDHRPGTVARAVEAAPATGPATQR